MAFFLAPAIPAGIEGAIAITRLAMAGMSAYEIYNYIMNNPMPSLGSPADIPIAKPELQTKQSSLSSLSSATQNIAKKQDDTKAQISSTLESLKASIESSVSTVKAQNQTILGTFANSPLLANQLMSKDTLDNLVNAINNQTVASVSMLGALESQLSSVGASLLSISGTLLKISGTYSDDISNTTDMPYINQDDYYKMLRDSGLSFDATNDLIQQERAYVQSLKNSGITDYSDIKRAVLSWRSQNVPSSANSSVSDNVAGLSKAWHGTTTRTIPASSVVGPSVAEYSTAVPSAQTVSLPEINLTMPNTEAWASIALGVFGAMSPDLVARNLSASVAIKEAQPADTISRELDARMKKAEYLVQDTAIKDLDGNVVANVKPMEATAIKAVTDARLRTDMNNIEEKDIDLDEVFPAFDLSTLFEFEKKSDRLSSFLVA